MAEAVLLALTKVNQKPVDSAYQSTQGRFWSLNVISGIGGYVHVEDPLLSSEPVFEALLR